MEAASIREYRHENLILPKEGPYLLKSNVLFGHNGSGKTNLIRALSTLRLLMLRSTMEGMLESSQAYRPFRLNEYGHRSPTEFEIEFICGGRHLRYQVAYDSKEVSKETLSEVLSRSEKLLVGRERTNFEFAREFKKEATLRQDFVRSSELCISKFAQLNLSWAAEIVSWFQNMAIFQDLDQPGALQDSARQLRSPENERWLLAFLANANLGFSHVDFIPDESPRRALRSNVFGDFIERVNARDDQPEFRISTKHRVKLGDKLKEFEFDLMTDESIGAQKFMALIGPVIQSLRHGKILIVDELDAHLSSFLIALILRLYNSAQHNTKGAQLIFSTQNTDVLEQGMVGSAGSSNFGDLRRDQISVFEKTESGHTKITSLHELGVRNDASYRKQYLEAKFFDTNSVPPGTQLNLFDGL